MEANAPLAREELRLLDAYWRAANYLSVGQIFLLDNPLLREPLVPEHVKPRLLGHFGTTPGLNLVYAHLNRAIRARDLQALYVTGPGHGGPGLVANAYLEGTYSEVYPRVSMDEDGPARALPPVLVPRRDPEPRRARDAGLDPRGRRARLRAHARVRRCLRQPRPARRVRRRRRRGRDRAARGELALEQVPEPEDRRRRAADPPPERLQDREPDRPRADSRAGARVAARGLRAPPDPRHGRLRRRGLRPPSINASPAPSTLRSTEIAAIQTHARETGAEPRRPRWPMIVLRTPKGWTGPKEVDGLPVEDSWRSHQVPMTDVRDNPEHLRVLEDWLRSYEPEELFDEHGTLIPELAELAAEGRAPDEREPATRTAASCSASSSCPTSATTRSRCRSPARPRARRRGCSARSSAT